MASCGWPSTASLVRVDDAVGGIRFGWLETVREHALGRLAASGEEDDVRDRHARAFADLAREAGASPAWRGAGLLGRPAGRG